MIWNMIPTNPNPSISSNSFSTFKKKSNVVHHILAWVLHKQVYHCSIWGTNPALWLCREHQEKFTWAFIVCLPFVMYKQHFSLSVSFYSLYQYIFSTIWCTSCQRLNTGIQYISNSHVQLPASGAMIPFLQSPRNIRILIRECKNRNVLLPTSGLRKIEAPGGTRTSHPHDWKILKQLAS